MPRIPLLFNISDEGHRGLCRLRASPRSSPRSTLWVLHDFPCSASEYKLNLKASQHLSLTVGIPQSQFLFFSTRLRLNLSDCGQSRTSPHLLRSDSDKQHRSRDESDTPAPMGDDRHRAIARCHASDDVRRAIKRASFQVLVRGVPESIRFSPSTYYILCCT